MYAFSNMTIYGLADKHAVISSFAIYAFKKIDKEFRGTDIEPPDNPRSWGHCLIVVETGGMRIVHWGDNHHDSSGNIWKDLGSIDIALLPVDVSQHVMGHVYVEAIIERLQLRVMVPHHYYIRDALQRQSTLQTVEAWVDARVGVEWITGRRRICRIEGMNKLDRAVHYFGDHVNFDNAA